MWEVKVDRNQRVHGFKHGTDQWLQQKDAVELKALWVRGVSAEKLKSGESIQLLWNPMFEANPFPRKSGEKRTAFIAALATDCTWEYEGTQFPSWEKPRNWNPFNLVDQAKLNAAYEANDAEVFLRNPTNGEMLEINFLRLEQTNMVTKQVRALQFKDPAGKIVRSWDFERLTEIRDSKTRTEFDNSIHDAMTNLSCYLHHEAFRSQLAWEHHDPAKAVQGDTPKDTMDRGIAAGLILLSCEFAYGTKKGQGVFSWKSRSLSTSKQFHIREKDQILIRRVSLQGDSEEPFEEAFEVIKVNRSKQYLEVVLPQKVPDDIKKGMWRLDKSNDDFTIYALQPAISKFLKTPTTWRLLLYGEIDGIQRKKLNLRVFDPSAKAEYARLLQSTNLDVSQRGACMAAYERCVTFVQGPPGTGKTGWAAKTLELLYKIKAFERMQRSSTEDELPMLAVAPTHTAVDTLLEGVLNVAGDINLKRFGKLLARKINDIHKAIVLPKSLEHLCKKEVGVYRSEALTKEEVGVYRSEAKSAHLLFGTIGGALLPGSLPVRWFSDIMVDEAAQVIEPETLPLLSMLEKSGRFVSVGDPSQLGAVVCQEYLQQTQFDRSLMARVLTLPGMETKLLTLSYRSHPSISRFSSKHIYGGALFVGGLTSPPKISIIHLLVIQTTPLYDISYLKIFPINV